MRRFTIVDYPQDGKNYGEYTAPSPKRAASKAFTRLSRMINLKNTDDKNFIVFAIKEIGGKNKIYKYIGTRVELHQPHVVNINGRNVMYRYKNIITKYNNIVENKV